MRKALAISFLLGMLCLDLQASPLKENFPNVYTVKKGDTLWGISSHFLNSPWLWPEVWHANPQIRNPHLIYPGDQLRLVYIDGKPRLVISSRGPASRTVKLSPTIRSTPIDSAIPAIPLDKIHAFLDRSRILGSQEDFLQAPYIVGSQQDRIVSGIGDLVYARGQFPDHKGSYGIFREGQAFIDPDTKEFLGILARDIGIGKVRKVNQDIATLQLQESEIEVRSGDRLLETLEQRVDATFFPRAPDQDISGKILAVVGGISQIGLYDNVVINLGEREGIQAGDVLAITKELVIQDRVAQQSLVLPKEKVGLLMVYRPFQKVSYAIILQANQAIHTGDSLKNP
jgi:nucleoid-associated protein YgaU